MASVTQFLKSHLRLRVNRQKSAPGFRRGRLTPVEERKFLGYRLDAEGDLGIAPKSLQRAKDRLRQITKRNRAISLEQMIGQTPPPSAGGGQLAGLSWRPRVDTGTGAVPRAACNA